MGQHIVDRWTPDRSNYVDRWSTDGLLIGRPIDRYMTDTSHALVRTVRPGGYSETVSRSRVPQSTRPSPVCRITGLPNYHKARLGPGFLDYQIRLWITGLPDYWITGLRETLTFFLPQSSMTWPRLFWYRIPFPGSSSGLLVYPAS